MSSTRVYMAQLTVVVLLAVAALCRAQVPMPPVGPQYPSLLSTAPSTLTLTVPCSCVSVTHKGDKIVFLPCDQHIEAVRAAMGQPGYVLDVSR